MARLSLPSFSLPSGSASAFDVPENPSLARFCPLPLPRKVGAHGWLRLMHPRKKADGAIAFTWLIGPEYRFSRSRERGGRIAPELRVNTCEFWARANPNIPCFQLSLANLK